MLGDLDCDGALLRDCGGLLPDFDQAMRGSGDRDRRTCGGGDVGGHFACGGSGFLRRTGVRDRRQKRSGPNCGG